MKKIIAIIAIALLLSACGDKKIDTSSEEAMKSSVQEISKSLNDEEKTEFEKAIMKFGFISSVESANTGESPIVIIKKYIGGKTASEVIDEAKNLKDPTKDLINSGGSK